LCYYLYKLFFLFLIFPFHIYSQEESLNNTLPEIGALRLEFIQEDLDLTKLYRLATFYLTAQQFGKAITLYNIYIERMVRKKIVKLPLSSAYYNKALASYSIQLYDSAKKGFLLAYQLDNQLIDSLRMIGTIFYLKKDKINTLKYWKQYLLVGNNSSNEYLAIQSAILLLESPDFTFDDNTPKEASPQEKRSPTWPFLDPDIIPYPDAHYEKKRVI